MRIYHAFTLGLLFLVGCNKGPDLTGKWNMLGGGAPQGAKMEIEFTSNTFKNTLNMSVTNLDIHIDTSGTYTITDNKIKMTTTDIKVDDTKLPPVIRDSIKQNVDKQKGKTQEGELKIEGDKATIKTADGEITLTRIK